MYRLAVVLVETSKNLCLHAFLAMLLSLCTKTDPGNPQCNEAQVAAGNSTATNKGPVYVHKHNIYRSIAGNVNTKLDNVKFAISTEASAL